MGVCWLGMEQNSDLRWRHANAWKQRLAWFWINCNQSLHQPNWPQIKRWNLKVMASNKNALAANKMMKIENHVVTSVEKMSINLWFEDYLSNLLSKTIIYCVTDQPSITWSWSSVLNFKLSVLTFSRPMSCSMSIKEWYFNSNICRTWYMYWSKVCVQELWYVVSGLDIQAKLSKNNNHDPACKKGGSRLRNTTSHTSFFLKDPNNLMAQWLRRVAVSQVTWVQFQ